MKIGIESQRIFRKAKHGMDVVALELSRQIQQLDHENQYLLFAANGEDRSCLRDTQNFRTKILPGITYAGWEQVSLPLAVRKFKPNLLHCTANTAPFRCAAPMIVTVHDIIYIEETSFKGSPYQNFGNLYRKFVVPRAIKRAEKIITVSNYEKAIITDICTIDPEKIMVVHNGVSERFHNKFSPEDIESFRKKHNLPPAFILFLGNTAPKKNTSGAIKAYMHYWLNTKSPLNLVVTDFPASSILKILEKHGQPQIMRNIITPGYIPSSDMPLMYNCASLFIYPSLRESFGLPVLEAMACGKPVITSDIPPLREVGGNAAIFVDPENPEAISKEISTLLEDGIARSEFVKMGLIRAGMFSWQSAAKKLIELYKTFS